MNDNQTEDQAIRAVELEDEVKRLCAVNEVLRAEITRLRTAMSFASERLDRAVREPTESAMIRAGVRDV